MANELNINDVLINIFSSLSIDEPGHLKEKFNEFYHDKVFDEYFKAGYH